jgi:hypothetical protein
MQKALDGLSKLRPLLYDLQEASKMQASKVSDLHLHTFHELDLMDLVVPTAWL